ncbi:MAG: hypothetical protein ACYTFW_26915 [Planctomycetota bacterium]|jgi:hypothetical protein
MRKRILIFLILSLFIGGLIAYAGPYFEGGSGGGDATSTATSTGNFNGNLSVTDTNVQTALETIDDIALGGDTTETNQDDAWAAVGASGTESGIDVVYQDATDDVDFIVDVTPSSGSATLEISEDAVQIKYDSTDFTEGANGLYLGASPTIATSLTVGGGGTVISDAKIVDDGTLLIQPSGDTTDYLTISTASDNITIGTIGGTSGDLIIAAAGGDISFGDENLLTRT